MASSTGVASRIAALLDRKKYSDVEFIVKESNGSSGYQTFYAHKLILATASRVFADAFYENTDKHGRKRVNAPDSTPPPACYAMLQYLYTDKLHLKSLKEAYEIYKLAKNYEIEVLSQKCSEYILQESIDYSNIFSIYECALKENALDVLYTCREFVQHEAKQVLESTDFSQACAIVVLDILKQDYLNINSELEIIDAVLKWCFYECKRQKEPVIENCLRRYLTPFLKHLRFLSLSPAEFFDFSENNRNIFNNYESIVLTTKILQSSEEIAFPEYLCNISRKRNLSSSLPYNGEEKNSCISKPFMQFPQLKPHNNEDVRNAYQKNLAYEEKVSKTLRRSSNRNDSSHSLSYNIKSSSAKSTNVELKNSFSHPTETLMDNGNSQYAVPISCPAKSEPSDAANFNFSSPVSYTIKVPPNHSHSESTTYSPHLSEKSQNDNKSRASREISPDCVNILSFNIPLEEAKKDISCAFNNDMKCNISMKMLKGSIYVHGIELSIKGRKVHEESIEVFLCLTGFSEKPIENVYEQKLTKNILEIKFPNPVKLQQNNRGEIEVTVENLRLDRSNVCRSEYQNHELIKGLDVKSEISLSSNQSTKEGFFFLISKINYSLC